MRLDLLSLIARDTRLRRTAAHQRGGYSGPRPLCRRGVDRFKVWPALGRWACLGASAGRAGCDLGGGPGHRQPDAPAVLSNSYPAPLCPPSAIWQTRGGAWAALCRQRLFGSLGERALAWLLARGLTVDTLRSAGCGYQPGDHFEHRALWGLPANAEGDAPRRVWRPLAPDVNAMATAGLDVAAWVEAGLRA